MKSWTTPKIGKFLENIGSSKSGKLPRENIKKPWVVLK